MALVSWFVGCTLRVFGGILSVGVAVVRFKAYLAKKFRIWGLGSSLFLLPALFY